MDASLADSLRSTIRQLIAEALMLPELPASLGDHDDLSAALGLDSVGYLEILTAMEESLQIRISDETVARHSFNTITRLASLAQRCRAADEQPR